MTNNKLKPLTPAEQDVYSLWKDNTRAQIADKLGKNRDTITALASNIRKKGYVIESKSQRKDDSAVVLASVKKAQRYFAMHGEGQAFQQEYRRIYMAAGFDSVTQYCHRVNSLMRKDGIYGSYADYVRGKIPGHRYIGRHPSTLTLQRWNGGLKL